MIYPLVSVIIVNFNQKKITLNCLKSFEKVTYQNYEIILVDNGSYDGSADAILKKYPSLKIIKNFDNTGFTGGNNVGFKIAKGEYVLLLNNDTKVTPSFLEPLIEDMSQNKDLGIVQSKIRVMDRPNLLDSVVSFQTFTGFLYHQGYLAKDGSKYQEFLYSFSGKGACILIRREVLKAGLFDDGYFAYFEETDLCWRTWLMGYKVGFEPRSIIYHKMGVTSAKMNRSFIHYHSFKNRIRTIIKNADGGTIIWMLPAHLLVCLGLILYFLLVEINGAKSILRAFWWNLANLPDTLKLRMEVQFLRKVSDKLIFREVMKNPSLSFYLNHLSLVRENLSNDRKT